MPSDDVSTALRAFATAHRRRRWRPSPRWSTSTAPTGTAQSVIADAAGGLFGATSYGGAYAYGTVFEIVNNGGGSYTPVTLVSFNGTNGANPFAALIADAAGDLFDTTEGAPPGFGTVFEIAKTGGGYASTPTTLVNITSTLRTVHSRFAV
jgi:hypothetical protein